MSNKKIIAICGNARSGKDTLGENLVLLLAEMGIKAKTCSFAEQLRIEVDDLLTKTIGISSFTKDNKEKKIIVKLHKLKKGKRRTRKECKNVKQMDGEKKIMKKI